MQNQILPLSDRFNQGVGNMLIKPQKTAARKEFYYRVLFDDGIFAISAFSTQNQTRQDWNIVEGLNFLSAFWTF